MSIQSRTASRRAEAAPATDSAPEIRLDRFVDDVERLGVGSPGPKTLSAWRAAALRGLTDVREVLVDESAASDRHDERGTVLLRERTGLLDRVSVLRLHVLGMEEVDRLSYDVRRLVADVRTHLATCPRRPARGRRRTQGPGGSAASAEELDSPRAPVRGCVERCRSGRSEPP